MQKKITLFLLIGSTFLGFTQETQMLKGHIIADTLPLEFINIVNSTLGIGTINNKSGYFEIKARVGDTIAFSSVQFQLETYVVRQKDLNEGNLEVYLQPSVNELEEVHISQYSLSGNIQKDLMTIPREEYHFSLWTATELKKMGVTRPDDSQSPVINSAIPSSNLASVSVDLEKLIDLFSGAFKKRKKEVEKGIHVTDFYNETFFTNQLNIPETEFYNFIDYLQEETGIKFMLQRGNGLRILEFLMHQVPKFKEKYNITE
ncbi:hypothetical protein GCM10022393_09480 [Aquimarina addita]|uniref:Carboxypeptidase-like regulatory domain-containing protein n=1 Tax=Aquimarina addita TaxID=870485 RepID=A0ABP7XD73_9FLAO